MWLGGPFYLQQLQFNRKGILLRQNPDDWSIFYQFLFVGLFVYFGWNYIIPILAVCGVYLIWREWDKS